PDVPLARKRIFHASGVAVVLLSFIVPPLIQRLNAVQEQSAQTVVAATAASGAFAVALLPPDTPCSWRFVEADAPVFIFTGEKSGVSFYLFHLWGTNAEILLSLHHQF
ncbi:hypothetical protein ACLZ37_005209, partial [Escherichia coli]